MEKAFEPHVQFSQLPFYACCFFAGLKELWSFRPKLFRPGRESFRPMTNSTLQDGLSEMLLVKLGFYCCDCSKTLEQTERTYWSRQSHSRYWNWLYIKTEAGLYVPQRSQRSLRRSLIYILCEVFTEKSCWSTCTGTVIHTFSVFQA